MAHVQQVLARLLENRLVVKAEKCDFHANSVLLLGVVIQEGSITAYPERIRTVANPGKSEGVATFPGVSQLLP